MPSALSLFPVFLFFFLLETFGILSVAGVAREGLTMFPILLTHFRLSCYALVLYVPVCLGGVRSCL